ncbi:hypothetical protein GlitD10_1484 [Gloeomargarita lithophora Alchichica-D10]|uniref:TIGR02652 family protein n=1 Tax=Gloeomargarita lithophora Alchichica-D10 TaxID=1188229 RepID=A0A1J0ACY8_9CYAN|nr:TIGR02652 family protein [Gloeomargarita lithophora]APB33806.1 hypothetical protein GlitD10_1484 [Gloeomargarita lithophora Alchichica-D10]
MPLISPSWQYPIFGPEIACPHCRQMIPALTLTDTYLCPRHGAFESNPDTGELVHLQSGRRWRQWQQHWYRQHTHPDGIRFEIHEALDQLYSQGYRATKVTIAQRYQELMTGYLEKANRPGEEGCRYRLYGLPVVFSPDPEAEPSWEVVNFCLDKEPGTPVRYPYLRLFD